jgi:hypothetical protein
MDQKAAAQAATPVGGAFRSLGSKPAWIAICVLLFNDLYLKYAFPSAVTGKLSDIAELFVLPLAAAAVVLAYTTRLPRLAIPIAVGVYTAIGAVFVAMKVDEGFATSVRSGFGPMTGGGITGVSDPTDLLCLPALFASFAFIYRGLRSPALVSRRWKALPALGFVIFASVANTPGVPPSVQLIADSTRAGTFYALFVDQDYYGGTYPRGIYRTIDAGRSWTRVSGSAQRFALDPEVPGGLLTLDHDLVSAVSSNGSAIPALRPSTATQQLYGTRRLFVVTSWPSSDIFIVSNGSLVRSQDRGASWVVLQTADKLSDVAAGQPEGSLYAVQTGRTRRSGDHGATWRDVGAFPTEFVRLSVDPHDLEHVVAATNKGIYVSVDGGANWASRWNKKTIAYPRDFSGGIVFDQDHAERVYATLGSGVGLLVSGDGGVTWNESELPALSVAVGREPGPRIFIQADYRGLFHESRGWPELEPWTKASAGLPFN